MERGSEMVEIREGSARMLYDNSEAVFYNKVQVFNRDISIQVIRLFASIRNQERRSVYQKKLASYVAMTGEETHRKRKDPPNPPHEGITILDALAATGLRSVRYLKEIEGVSHLTINDILPEATAAAIVNIQQNGVDSGRVTVNTGDATMLMYEHRDPLKNFDVIDLDPYGTASPFLVDIL